MTHPDGSTWFRWTAAPGYFDQLELSDALGTWTPSGPPVYGFGHPVEVKLRDPRAAPSGGGGEPWPETLSLDGVVDVFADGRILLSFTDDDEPVKVLLGGDLTGAIERPFYARTFERPDPETDFRVFLFFMNRPWETRYEAFALAGLDLSPEATEIIDAFLAHFALIRADLLAPPTGGNQTAQGQVPLPPGSRNFVRIVRTHADLDHDGIADALEFAGLAGLPSIVLDPFATDANGNGIPDFLEALAATGDLRRPGAGDEDDPNDEPLPAFTPPHFAVLPLGGDFILASASESFASAWITDASTVAAVKNTPNGPLHLVSQDQETSELWPKGTDEYPKGKILDASRAGAFLMEVHYKEGVPPEVKQEYRVVQDDDLDSLAGTAITAAIPEGEIKALPYYVAQRSAFLAAGNQIEDELITQGVRSVYQISETGNVVGSIHIDVILLPVYTASGGTTTTSSPIAQFAMVLPYFWKTGAGGGTTGSLHRYFTPDAEGRYWTEAGGGIDGPTFNFDYFGGVDTLVHYDTGAARKIGVTWPGTTLPQYSLPVSYVPRDGNGWGGTVSAGTAFETRTLADFYDDSQFPVPGPPNPDLTNDKWWNLAEINRLADPANNLPAIDGPAFVIKASDGNGYLTWQAWPMEELVGGLSGDTPEWSDLKPKHLANTGAVVAELMKLSESQTQLVIAQPVVLKVNGTEAGEDDFIAVSAGTDEDLATDFSIESEGMAGVHVSLAIKGTDGDLKFKDTSLTLPVKGAAKTKLWGKTTSSGRDKTLIELTFTKGAKELGKLIEKVTVFEGVEIGFGSTFYSPVDLRDRLRRPSDGIKKNQWGAAFPIQPAAFANAPFFAAAMEEDMNDQTSSIVFAPGDQDVTLRAWAPEPEVIVNSLSTLTPAVTIVAEEATDPAEWKLKLGKISSPSGSFLDRGGNDGVVDPVFGFHFNSMGTGEADQLLKIKVTNRVDDTEMSLDTPGVPLPTGPFKQRMVDARDSGDAVNLLRWGILKYPNDDIADLQARQDPYAPYALSTYFATIHSHSRDRAIWENSSFGATKGAALSNYPGEPANLSERQFLAVLKGIAGWREAKGDKSVRCSFQLSLFDEWTLTGALREGKLETIEPNQ